MANNVNVKKLEADLWESADLLRAGSKLTSNQYCMPVLGLIFLRYAYSRFKLVEQEILKDRPMRGGRVLPVEQSDFAEKSALFLPKEAQYNYLVNLPANIPEQGLTGVIKSGDEANTFYHDAHNLNGCCDYVMANPPFNVDKVKSESAQSAGRLPFGLPGVNKAKEIGNANYLWVSYFYSYLNEHGRAGFVMASSATDSQGKDKDIREKLIQTGHVDVMMSVGNNFFYTKSLPCSLWFLDKGKPEHLLDTVLFIDARNYYTVVDRTQNEWSDWQLKNLNAIVWLYRGEVDKYKVLLAEYHAELADDRPFAEIQAALEQNVQAKREEAKAAVDAAPRKERKTTQEKFDKALEALNEKLTVAKEAVWLTEKFGEGVYQDIPGLCKVASRDTILNEKGASLTPGAYVGVAPVEDDGVDFAQRMKEIHKELLELQAESNRLMETISKNLEEMGV